MNLSKSQTNCLKYAKPVLFMNDYFCQFLVLRLKSNQLLEHIFHVSYEKLHDESVKYNHALIFYQVTI